MATAMTRQGDGFSLKSGRLNFAQRRLWALERLYGPRSGGNEQFAFQLDGIFIGTTRTADMRNMMIVSAAVYYAAWWLLTPPLANHGLWASLIIFFVVRGLTLGARMPALVGAVFGGAGTRS